MEELKAEEVELVKNRLRRELDDATSRWSKLLKREDLPDDIKKGKNFRWHIRKSPNFIELMAEK